MKRFLCGILSICLVLGLSGCADDTFADVKLDQEETLDEVTFRVDSGWETESDYDSIHFYPFNTQDKGFFVVQSQTLNHRMDKTKLNHDDIKGNVYDFVDSWFKGNSSSAVVSFGKYNNEFPSAHISGTVAIDGKNYDFNSNILITSSHLYGFSVVQRGEIQSSFQEAVKLVIDSVSVEESTIYESFDDYTMSMSFLEDSCTVLSHSIIGTEDGSYRWDLDIENVTDMDGLMVFSELVGLALNPPIQKHLLVDGAVPVGSASIDINHGQAFLFLFPPAGSAPLFVSSVVIKDEYEKKDELQAAYDKYMYDSDFGNVLASMGGNNKTSSPSSAPAEQDKPAAAVAPSNTGIEGSTDNSSEGTKFKVIITDPKDAQDFANKNNIPLNHAKNIEMQIKTMTDYSLDDVSNLTVSYESESTIQYDFKLNGEDFWAMMDKGE